MDRTCGQRCAETSTAQRYFMNRRVFREHRDDDFAIFAQILDRRATMGSPLANSTVACVATS
jgi:hypothetical protein